MDSKDQKIKDLTQELAASVQQWNQLDQRNEERFRELDARLTESRERELELEEKLRWVYRNIDRIRDSAHYAKEYRQCIEDTVDCVQRSISDVLPENRDELQPVRVCNAAKFTVTQLFQRIADIARTVAPDYPNVGNSTAWEQLWAIEQAYLGTRAAARAWEIRCLKTEKSADEETK
jgi:chromosome condensin MukBEF ATPase and DNA-binding subunit MukB